MPDDRDMRVGSGYRAGSEALDVAFAPIPTPIRTFYRV